MRKLVFIAFVSLFLLSISWTTFSSDDPVGPSANGVFHVPMDNGQSGEVTFDAHVAKDGNTTGAITFRAELADENDLAKPVDDDEENAKLPPFYAKASCDCLVVKGVEAALSGTVTESSRKSFIGRRVVLVVQDGDSLTPPLRDKLTFGFYRPTAKGWVESDSERPADEESQPNWVATDNDRPEDTGRLAKKTDEITCTTVPISAHSFITAKQGRGTIQVTR